MTNTGSGEGAYEETVRLIILGPLVTLFVKTFRWKHGMDITLETPYTGLIVFKEIIFNRFKSLDLKEGIG